MEGARLRISGRILDRDDKLVHYFIEMHVEGAIDALLRSIPDNISFTDATLRAARAYVMTELDRAMAIAGQRDEPLDAVETGRVNAAVAWATESICQAAMRLLPYAGAGALHLDNPIQRSFRDLVGSGQHLVATNEALEQAGRTLLAAAADST